MEKFNVLLTSSGFNDINNYVSEDIKEIFKRVAKDKKVMILANAAPKGQGNFIARDNVRDNFLNVGASKVDIIDLSDDFSIMLDYDVIYGLGGDPVYLIRLNENPNFKEVLVEFLKQGIFIGESAGSMIFGQDLKWCYDVKKGSKPKYDIVLDTYKGLGLTTYNIYPHWNTVKEKYQQKCVNYEQDNDVTITKLNDGEYISLYVE